MTTTKWTIDPGHSEIQFKVKHLAIANVTGNFKVFAGSIESDKDDFHDAAISFQMDAGSIDTNNTERDKHLKSDLFFNA